MKTKKLLLIILIFSMIFTTEIIFLHSINYGIINTDDYQKGNYFGACKFNYIDNETVQLSNCAKYKINSIDAVGEIAR